MNTQITIETEKINEGSRWERIIETVSYTDKRGDKITITPTEYNTTEDIVRTLELENNK